MDKNPIIATVGNLTIRERSNSYHVLLTGKELYNLAIVAQSSGLSISKVIALQGQSCQSCGCDNITITIPKNILSTKKQNGGNSRFYKEINELPDQD